MNDKTEHSYTCPSCGAEFTGNARRELLLSKKGDFTFKYFICGVCKAYLKAQRLFNGTFDIFLDSDYSHYKIEG